MIIQANSFGGYLDISAPEVLGSTGFEWLGAAAQYRHVVKTGDILLLPDEYLRFPNILNAVNLGLLTVVSYDSRDESIVINAELKGIVAGKGTPGTKYVFLDIHGGEDTEEIRDASGTPYLAFKHGRDSRTRWNLTVPEDYQAGTTIILEIYWSNGTSSTGNVRWSLEYKDVSPGSSISSGPTTVSTTQSAPSMGLLTTTGAALAIPGGVVAANDLLSLAAVRSGGDAADTLMTQAQLYLARISYTGLRFSS